MTGLAKVFAKVYELDMELQPPGWKLIGNITDYNPPAIQSNLYAAKLSGNGEVLVTSTHKEDFDTFYPELSYYTHKWNSMIGSWELMDDKGGLLSKTRENITRACMAVSDNGTVLAVCSGSGIEVYSWNADKSSWIPRDVVFACNEECPEYVG
jgi:hypothetical protein